MSNEWNQMLVELGIGPGEGDKVAPEVAAVAAGNQPQLVDLTNIAVLEITGEDALSFLQGQFCNDLTTVSSTHAQITGYCTPKGRLLALPTVIGTADGVRMLVPQSLKESFVKRLSMFVMRSRVVIEERKDWLCTGVIAAQDGTTAQVDEWLGALPGGAMDAATSDIRQVIRWHDYPEIPASDSGNSATRSRYIVLASEADQLGLWNSCTHAAKRDAALWRAADIRAGVPTLSPATSEAFVPQMVNLQLIDALSFTKGCYPGQEIVARMQYLGKLKRHMRAFSMSPDAADDTLCLKAGDSVSTDAGADAGIVVDAVRQDSGGMMVLAVVKVSTNDATLCAAGATLSPITLPYDLPSLTQPAVDAC